MVSIELTAREELVVKLIADGLRNEDIARVMGVTSVHVVKNWIRAIYDKSGFDNRVEIALWYVRYRELRKGEK